MIEITTIQLVFLTFFLAAFIKGTTGLGFATSYLGFVAIFIDLKLAIPLVIIPSLSSNIMVMVEAGRFYESLKRFWLLFFSALPGLLLGLWVLGESSNGVSKGLLGLVLFLYGTWGLYRGLFTLSDKMEKLLSIPIGVTSGFVNGATGSQIMPILPYLLSLKIDKDLFVQAINTSFTFSTCIMIVGLGRMGLLSDTILVTSCFGVIPVALGIWIGGKVRKRVSEELFVKLVLLLLIFLGLSLMIRFILS